MVSINRPSAPYKVNNNLQNEFKNKESTHPHIRTQTAVQQTAPPLQSRLQLETVVINSPHIPRAYPIHKPKG